jgi:hypothetical protein
LTGGVRYQPSAKAASAVSAALTPSSGIQGRPLKRLLGAHREAENQLDPPDAQMFRHETMLTHDIVVHGDIGKDGAVERRSGVAGRGGQTVPEQVGHDDEVLLRVEAAPSGDRRFVLRVSTAIERRHHDDVVSRRIEFPVGLVRQLDLGQGQPALKRYRS